MSFTVPPEAAAMPVKGELRLIFDQLQHAEAAADYLERISGGRVATTAVYKGRKGGWIVKGYLKLPERRADEPP